MKTPIAMAMVIMPQTIQSVFMKLCGRSRLTIKSAPPLLKLDATDNSDGRGLISVDLAMCSFERFGLWDEGTGNRI